MNLPINEFLLMEDAQLAEATARLKRTVNAMLGARGETGLRIRAHYAEALDAARLEIKRRRI